MEQELFDGEYFIQKIQWKDLRAKSPLEVKSMVGGYSPEAAALLEKEGPKYQYGRGCLADGVLGAWMALVCGVGQVLDRRQGGQPPEGRPQVQPQARPVRATPTRSGPATPAATRAGCCLCTWPKGGELVAAVRLLQRGLDRHRVPGGLAPDAHGPGRGGAGDRPRLPRPLRRPRPQPVQRIRVRPLVRPGHVVLRPAAGPERRPLRRGGEGALPASPACPAISAPSSRTATGYGTVGVRGGKPFLEVKAGTIEVRQIKHRAFVAG